MRLRRLKVQGFRSLYRSTLDDTDLAAQNRQPSFDGEPGMEIDLDRLTVLIGCNDAGKSSVLDVLDIVLSNGRPEPSDFHHPVGKPLSDGVGSTRERVDGIRVVLDFEIAGDPDRFPSGLLPVP